jgi:hypothetical protein
LNGIVFRPERPPTAGWSRRWIAQKNCGKPFNMMSMRGCSISFNRHESPSQKKPAARRQPKNNPSTIEQQAFHAVFSGRNRSQVIDLENFAKFLPEDIETRGRQPNTATLN